MTVFISGGCKNGKSTIAQKIAKKLSLGGPLYYIATMVPLDDEDNARISRHLAERQGLGFETLECGTDLPAGLRRADMRGTFLLDSVTAYLTNEMFTGEHGLDADKSAPGRCEAVLIDIAARARNAVFVSDFIYSDAQRYGEFTETYRRGLARLDRALAARCDCVIEVCAGNMTAYKGEIPL